MTRRADPVRIVNVLPDAWLKPIRSEVESDQLTQEIEEQLLVEEVV